MMSPAAAPTAGGSISPSNPKARLHSGEIQRSINHTEKLLEDIWKLDDYSIGDFLATMLNHSEHLSALSWKVLSLWLGGHTKQGTRPAEIVDAMYCQQFSYTHVDRQVCMASFNSLYVPEQLALARSVGATSFLPPVVDTLTRSQLKVLYNAREGIEEWAARLVLWFINCEATELEQSLEPAEAPTWSQIEDFLLEKEWPTMKSKAPIIWKSIGRQNTQMERSASNSSSSSESSGDSEPNGLSPVERAKNKAMEQAEMHRDLTVDTLYNAIDEEHRAKIGTATILRILTKHVDSLKSLWKAVELLFQDPDFCAVLCLCLRKTRVLSMGTSGINEAVVSGASDVLDDLCQQAGMEPEWFDFLLMLVKGDQLTVDRLRKAINYLDQEESIYHSKSWAIPLIQPWHMGWAYRKSIFQIHWFELTGKDTLGFRRAVGILGRNPNPANYYPTEDAVVTVFETMVLSAARVLLRQEHGMIECTATNSKGFQLLEELECYFDPDGPLCNMEYLSSLACKIYNNYMTTKAYHSALSDLSTPAQPSAVDIQQVLRSKMEKQLQDSKISAPTLATTSDQATNALEFIEFTAAMQEGNTGRLYKVIDTLVFAFWGSKSTNYGSELLEMACNMHYEYPKALKQAIMNNYLVNPSGLPGKWQARDFLQEHFNKDIKTIYNKKGTGFDDRSMWESISLNIPGFSLVKDLFLKVFHLAETGKRRTLAQQHQDMNVLAAHFEQENFFQFVPGQSQPYQALDIIAAGHTQLD
ncbi:hypothetical protein V565_058670 [Rhizoctonia solani 123E]|uniref:DUF6589 domain-containing protein n=1 Tax=Rhizoctonia solani 123E TaxID=1423351 RepID=A0A074S208_9AGAM|nr:hypothetical protein V565_058670 [Rhizoctonia solani 123E]